METPRHSKNNLMKRNEEKVYVKDSMDRFGDDLTELILSYLTLEDKFRLECVSKQWKRYIFNKQFVIEIEILNKNPNEANTRKINYLNERILESVLKKCPNIRKVIISDIVDSSVLSLIGRYCQRIKSLKLRNISSDEQFFPIYGHKLEELEIKEKISQEAIIHYLICCPNLKTISLTDYSVVCIDAEEYLPRFEIMDNYHEIYPVSVKEVEILSDKYSKTMKSAKFDFTYLSVEELKTCLVWIARFENLRSLQIAITMLQDEKSENMEPIDKCLKLIGQKCTKVLHLDLFIDASVPISDRFFDVVNHFKALKKLRIELMSNTSVKGSVECFKHCQQLYDIDIDYMEITEDFFANSGSFVPKLQYLRVVTQNKFSDSFTDSLKSLKNIQSVEYIFQNEDYQTIHSQTNYFGKCSSIERFKDMDVIRVPIISRK